MIYVLLSVTVMRYVVRSVMAHPCPQGQGEHIYFGITIQTIKMQQQKYDQISKYIYAHGLYSLCSTTI